MLKKRPLLWLAGFGFLLGLGWYFLWSARTPRGQPPLTYLGSDPRQFAYQFNKAPGNARLVLLLSPT
jgi:hypothetical protein